MSDTLSKILFASFDVVPEPTGSSARTTELLKCLTPYFTVDAITAKSPDHGHIERYFGARLLRVPVGSGDVPARAEAFDRAVRRQLKSEEYDLVHFTDPFAGYALCELRASHGYKLVYEPRGFPSIELKYTDPQLEGDRRFLTKVRRQEIFCLMNADTIIVSNEVSRDHIASLGVPKEKLRLIPPAVDLEDFTPAAGPTGDPLRLVYIGSHAAWQGLTSLMFGLRIAAQQVPFKCRIIGPTHGSWQRQHQETIREFKLSDKVTLEYPVPHEEIPNLLAQNDVGLAPLMKSDRNQLQGTAPMKIAEYLVAGRPVIAADLPLTRAMIVDGETGLLYPPTDEDALGQAIVRLAKDKELRLRLAEQAGVYGRKSFDAQLFRAAILRTYHEQVSPSIIVSDDAFSPPVADAGANEEGPTVTFTPAHEAPTVSIGLDQITQPHGDRPDGPTNVLGKVLPPGGDGEDTDRGAAEAALEDEAAGRPAAPGGDAGEAVLAGTAHRVAGDAGAPDSSASETPVVPAATAEAAAGEAAAGEAAAGEAAAGEAATAEAATGEAATGEAATGEAATAEAATGEAATGEAATGEAATGEAATAEAATGEAATAEGATGEGATGEAATAEAATAEAATGEAATGEAATAEAATAEAATAEAATAEAATGEAATGEAATGEAATVSATTTETATSADAEAADAEAADAEAEAANAEAANAEAANAEAANAEAANAEAANAEAANAEAANAEAANAEAANAEAANAEAANAEAANAEAANAEAANAEAANAEAANAEAANAEAANAEAAGAEAADAEAETDAAEAQAADAADAKPDRTAGDAPVRATADPAPPPETPETGPSPAPLPPPPPPPPPLLEEKRRATTPLPGPPPGFAREEPNGRSTPPPGFLRRRTDQDELTDPAARVPGRPEDQTDPRYPDPSAAPTSLENEAAGAEAPAAPASGPWDGAAPSKGAIPLVRGVLVDEEDGETPRRPRRRRHSDEDTNPGFKG